MVNELYRHTTERLRAVSGQCAEFDARLLIEAAKGDGALLESLIARRLANEPTQYILGEWEFYGLPFYVGKGVLIPRPDTEVLVERALEAIKDIPNPRVLDLCAGSGCISVAIKHCRPDARVCAVELYEQAAQYLNRNIALNGVEVEVKGFDVLEIPEGFGEYDLIVSNPPYIDAKAMAELDKEVKCEPETALFGGEDGLIFYRAIAQHWCPLLSERGIVVVEIGFDQAKTVSDIFNLQSIKAEVFRDYGGNDRVIIGTPHPLQ